MIAPVALALTVFLILYLIRRDLGGEPATSSAIWIPTIWLLINGSRQPSQWLEVGPLLSSQSLHEGNPVDQLIYGALIFVGVLILIKRRVRFGKVIKENIWIFLFFLFAGLSVTWSDFPLVSLKRWIKALGDLVMILVLLSDPFPVRAVTATIRRCGFILIPISLLFCKYYDHLGRKFDDWGNASYVGVTLDKNMFGYLLFLFGLFFASSLVRGFDQHRKGVDNNKSNQIANALMMAMIVWLIPIANSQTSLIALLAGVSVILALHFSKVRRYFWPYLLTLLILAGISNELFFFEGAVLEASGRDATLTGRTDIWETVLAEPINPIIGTGYASFWLGERLLRIWAMYPRTPLIQAHNGYIEVYLNLGIIGLMLLICVIGTGLRNTRRRLTAHFSTEQSLDAEIFQTFGVAYALAYLLYNVTEATFSGLNILFCIFLLLAFRHHENPVQPNIRKYNQSSSASQRPAPRIRAASIRLDRK